MLHPAAHCNGNTQGAHLAIVCSILAASLPAIPYGSSWLTILADLRRIVAVLVSQ